LVRAEGLGSWGCRGPRRRCRRERWESARCCRGGGDSGLL